MYSRGADPRYRGLPTHFSLPKQTTPSTHLASAPPPRGYSMVSMTTPLHRTMPNAEARQRQQTMRNRQRNTKVSVKIANLSSPRGNYENAFPVNIAPWKPEEGNININSRVEAKRAMYNMVNRSRHAALWKKEFENVGKKSRRTRRTTRKRKYGGGENDPLREVLQNLRYIRAPLDQKKRILEKFKEIKKSGLATIPEYHAILELFLMKQGISPNIDVYNIK